MADSRDCDVFYAYPGSSALLAETMQGAAEKLAQRSELVVRTWEELRVDGRLIISEVLKAIDLAGTVVAEITAFNSNVLFEVGYAIASEKQVLLCLDTTDAQAMRDWKEFGLLSNVGFTPYAGSSEALVSEFLTSRPDLREDRLWEDLLVSGGAGPRRPHTIFYYPLGGRADPRKAVDRALNARKDLAVVSADEEEQGLAPLSLYAVQIYQATCALLHLRGPQRARAVMHNARASLLAGMAHALKLPTLLVAEEAFEPPLDYKDLLYRYPTAKQLANKCNAWLDGLPLETARKLTGRVKLLVELPIGRFGEYVAENEQDRLPEYFVQTGQYQRVLSSQTAVFIGRKGTGKTANMLTAAEALSEDRRNLVTVIKPSGYELESLLAILEMLPAREVADYLLDGLWRYMLMTEIACSAVREAEGRAAGIASGSDMAALRAYLEEYGGHELNFAVRLERLIDELQEDLQHLPASVEDSQAWLNQKLYASALIDLRKLMGSALHQRERVAVLIDNLDKAWERGADREQQSRMILGLLSAVGRVERDFRKETAWRQSVHVTLAVFLRADIFDEVRKHAREPDKITTLQVEWDDEELLARVIEDRYMAEHPGETSPDELWTDFFCETVSGRPTRDFLLWRSLPRPRDLVYLCNACVLNAINRKHHRIEEQDVLAAQEDYSRFAFDALRVEGANSNEFDNVLLEFAGADATMDMDQTVALIDMARETTSTDTLLSKLLHANFLGIEVAEDDFDYPAAAHAEKRARILASKLEQRSGRPIRLTIHPAFRPYLGIAD